MSLRYETLLGPVDKVWIAIDRIRAFEPSEGYRLAFSGGKDSQCVYHLAKASGVKFEAYFNVTSVDPPELMRFIREKYPDVIWNHPKDKDGKPITMWTLIREKGFLPDRKIRYCCERLKESGGGAGSIVLTGVRWAESLRRKHKSALVQISGGARLKKRGDIPSRYREARETPYGLVLNYDNDESQSFVKHCYRTYRTTVNPIIDWEDEDVLEYLAEIAVPHCTLYDEGFDRIGCIGCPMIGKAKQIREFERWPRYLELYDKACNDAGCTTMSEWLGIGGLDA